MQVGTVEKKDEFENIAAMQKWKTVMQVEIPLNKPVPSYYT